MEKKMTIICEDCGDIKEVLSANEGGCGCNDCDKCSHCHQCSHCDGC